jgi:hypothetical protein
MEDAKSAKAPENQPGAHQLQAKLVVQLHALPPLLFDTWDKNDFCATYLLLWFMKEVYAKFDSLNAHLFIAAG